ncbi:glucose-6-phosphate isomerase [Candidatus Peregrinibacteria bacterium]|nr:glucose-6-phosphate isomerase [Candidatus Peregrinibacteria bacterium]
MISLDISGLSQIDSSHGLSLGEIESESSRISGFLEKIHARDQGFYQNEVLENEELVLSIEKFAKKVKGKYDYVVVLGIGGSSLGMIALKDAFGNLFLGTHPQIYILDNIDPVFISECEEVLNLQKTLFLVITKSGGTPETLSQYFYFLKKVEEKKLVLKEHFVFITDPKKGLLREEVEKKGIPSFPVPENVGGRFSVLTAVGLVPAALIDVNIQNLLNGAKAMREKFLSQNISENLPFQIATIQYLLSKKGKNITVMMPYAQKLFRFADWYRQLLAESIGKEKNENGEKVHTGLTPVNALGVTDQHSQAQLYMEGPNDKFILFLEVEKFEKDIEIPLPKEFHDSVHFLENTSFAKLMRVEKKATADALTEYGKPNITVHIPEISEEHLGELFLLFEGAIAFLGEYFGINAFDQPGVELSKNLTKKYLLE